MMRRRRSLVGSIFLIFAACLVTSFQTPTTQARTATGFRIPPLMNKINDNENEQNDASFASSSSSKNLLSNTDTLLKAFRTEEETSRRLFFASALFASGAALSYADEQHSAASAAMSEGNLQWQASPVNKRYGVTVFDAEQAGYNVKFVTYLSRFLLGFDTDCQRWWYSRASDLPRRASADEVNEMRLQQFAAFSASVEVGLQEYRDENGSQRLMNALLSRYCPDNNLEGGSDSTTAVEEQRLREIKEARRQVALLFGLMEINQPVDAISKLLAAIDNGSITSVEIAEPGTGYAPGYGPPNVEFPKPDAGDDYEQATGRAVIRPNGRILRIDLVGRGYGYEKPPTVTISPPASSQLGFSEETSRAATARAFCFRQQGVNKGRIERIQIVDPGAGYIQDEPIKIRISPPDIGFAGGGILASATAVLEYEVCDVTILNPGTGYAVEKPIKVYIEPPPLTARVNMNDPLMMARATTGGGGEQPTMVSAKNLLRKKDAAEDPLSVAARIEKQAVNDGKGGGGGCIGRACYDKKAIVYAYPIAEMSSKDMFRSTDAANKAVRVETALEYRSSETVWKKPRPKKPTVSGTSSGPDSKLPNIPSFGGGSSPSAQLLSLLPEGIGLEYSNRYKRYRLASGPGFPMWTQQLASTKQLDPEYGPRGRSPIEREMELGVAAYLRFSASGAVCCSAVHLAVTPIDVVKTKIQTDPVKYNGVLSSFKRVIDEEGLNTFFTGWQPTFIGFFVWGGFTYAMTEFFRRYFTALAGETASSVEVPIILAAAGIGAFFGAFTLSPFESVRIRSVAQPDFADSIVGVVKRMIDEEGLSSLFSAVPVFWLKEIPFAMAKFTVFDLSTAYMYETFPAAKEDLQLSLLVSLIGGTLGGVAAAIVSNPADATITEMKKAQSDMGPKEAAQKMTDREGPPAFLKGLSLRMVFYAMVVSLQFLVYDAVRFALGIGADDLKLYLDVLGGALQANGGGPSA